MSKGRREKRKGKMKGRERGRRKGYGGIRTEIRMLLLSTKTLK